MLKEGSRTNFKGLKRYFKANPRTLFIVAFQVFLLSAGGLLASGNSYAANEIAVYAFYALAIGVAVQVAVIIREDRKRARADRESQPKSS